MAWHGRGLCLLLFCRLGLETCHMIFRVSVFLFLWKTVISIYMGIAMNLCIPFESIATFVILIQINEDGRFRLLAFFSIYVFSLFKFSIRYLSPFWLWLYLNIFKLLWMGIFFFFLISFPASSLLICRKATDLGISIWYAAMLLKCLSDQEFFDDLYYRILPSSLSIICLLSFLWVSLLLPLLIFCSS